MEKSVVPKRTGYGSIKSRKEKEEMKRKKMWRENELKERVRKFKWQVEVENEKKRGVEVREKA